MTQTKNIFATRAGLVIGALICTALWGSAFPCIKIGYSLFQVASEDTASQILFAGCRFTLAGILSLLIGSCLRKKPLLPTRKAAPAILTLALYQTVLQYLLFYMGLARTSGVKSSIIESMSVFASILIASLLFRQEKLSGAKALGCLIGFIGVVLINLNGLEFSVTLLGEGALFLSTISCGLSAVYLKKFSGHHDPVMLSGSQFVAGGLVLALAGALLGGRLRPVSPGAFLLLLYLAMISAVAYSLWGVLLKYNPVSRVSVFNFMIPVFGVFLSALLLGERDQAGGLMSVLALILVSVGIYLVNRGSGRAERN